MESSSNINLFDPQIDSMGLFDSQNGDMGLFGMDNLELLTINPPYNDLKMDLSFRDKVNLGLALDFAEILSIKNHGMELENYLTNILDYDVIELNANNIANYTNKLLNNIILDQNNNIGIVDLDETDEIDKYMQHIKEEKLQAFGDNFWDTYYENYNNDPNLNSYMLKGYKTTHSNELNFENFDITYKLLRQMYTITYERYNVSIPPKICEYIIGTKRGGLLLNKDRSEMKKIISNYNQKITNQSIILMYDPTNKETAANNDLSDNYKLFNLYLYETQHVSDKRRKTMYMDTNDSENVVLFTTGTNRPYLVPVMGETKQSIAELKYKESIFLEFASFGGVINKVGKVDRGDYESAIETLIRYIIGKLVMTNFTNNTSGSWNGNDIYTIPNENIKGILINIGFREFKEYSGIYEYLNKYGIMVYTPPIKGNK